MRLVVACLSLAVLTCLQGCNGQLGKLTQAQAANAPDPGKTLDGARVAAGESEANLEKGVGSDPRPIRRAIHDSAVSTAAAVSQTDLAQDQDSEAALGKEQLNGSAAGEKGGAQEKQPKSRMVKAMMEALKDADPEDVPGYSGSPDDLRNLLMNADEELYQSSGPRLKEMILRANQRRPAPMVRPRIIRGYVPEAPDVAPAPEELQPVPADRTIEALPEKLPEPSADSQQGGAHGAGDAAEPTADQAL